MAFSSFSVVVPRIALYIEGQYINRNLTIMIFCFGCSPAITGSSMEPTGNTCSPVNPIILSRLISMRRNADQYSMGKGYSRVIFIQETHHWGFFLQGLAGSVNHQNFSLLQQPSVSLPVGASLSPSCKSFGYSLNLGNDSIWLPSTSTSTSFSPWFFSPRLISPLVEISRSLFPMPLRGWSPFPLVSRRNITRRPISILPRLGSVVSEEVDKLPVTDEFLDQQS